MIALDWDRRTGQAPARARLIARLSESASFRSWTSDIAKGERPILAGVTGALGSLVAVALANALKVPVLFVVAGEEEARAIEDDLGLLLSSRVSRRLPSEPNQESARALMLRTWSKEGGVLTTSIRALLERTPSGEVLDAQLVTLEVGKACDRDALLERLGTAGLLREAQVVREGTFSVRGDLVDIFPASAPSPLRIEFQDDELSDIRTFDPGTQLSVGVQKSATLCLPAGDPGSHAAVALDSVPPAALILLRDPASLEEAVLRHLATLEEAAKESLRDAYEALIRRKNLVLSRLRGHSELGYSLESRVVVSEGKTLETALRTLARISAQKSLTVVSFENEGEAGRFCEILGAADSPWPKAEGERPIDAVLGHWSMGFHCPLLGIAVLDYQELFSIQRERRRSGPETKPAAAATSRPLDSFLDLQIGDYVVHLAHGIGRFLALERIDKGGRAQDFLVLQFQNDVRLHVPASKIELVQKYLGGKGEAPELSKLGGSAWDKRKQAVASALDDFAGELLELQAIRAQKSGLVHAADTPWQAEFEASFPFTLTKDQASAVADIKKDLESSRPMDRLLCGDVGYGKTEVAMRAAFKVVMGGRQVAVLVPTTVLAQQHWETFRVRMKDYPVTIECLSRFQSGREQKRVIEALAAGQVDIVIGTHRVVQGDVVFRDLGLMVIDEEQRFGVVDKERLRRIRRDVDVLTLTATPIPRTLHQSMVGIRDISSLMEAPRGRLEIHSEVVERSDTLLAQAIRRELDRQGQMFFVHNRVQTIDRVATQLQSLVPEARFTIAHGQMGERELESAMLAFVERRADVLVATTIIESGLDIPTANTLFVDEADHYGLAELHQLRGRVGRYHHQAFAYFLLSPGRVQSDVAMKRLRAIEEFSALGAGFRISMRDLEIRGAGNILGTEQSGHIAAVGYELYCRLLKQAVQRLRREEVIVPEEVEINVDFTAFLPEGYIPDAKSRIEIYRRLGRAVTESELAMTVAEMKDRFGPPPKEAAEFVLVARIRALMERCRVGRLELLERQGVLLRTRRMNKLKAMVRWTKERVREIEGKALLLVHPGAIRGPAHLLEILESALAARM